MVRTDDRQESSLPSKRHDLRHVFTIRLTDDAGQELRMAIVAQKIETGKNGSELIRPTNPFIGGGIQRIEADREGDPEVVELRHERDGQFGAVRNHRQMEPDLVQVLEDSDKVSTEQGLPPLHKDHPQPVVIEPGEDRPDFLPRHFVATRIQGQIAIPARRIAAQVYLKHSQQRTAYSQIPQPSPKRANETRSPLVLRHRSGALLHCARL